MSEFHSTFLRTLENQHPCFGHRLAGDQPAEPCRSCIMQEACGERQIGLLIDFAPKWSLSLRIGREFQEQELTAMAPCQHCKKIMLPDEGKVVQVKGKGAYHPSCMEKAFPLT